MVGGPAIAVDDKSTSKTEVRFAFGKNWQRFLRLLNEARVAKAEHSLRDMLQVENLHEQSFLDAGCGSGVFSLAAMRLGARHVHSFDYDRDSVACAQELKRCFFQGAPNWTIERGDVLNPGYLSPLGQFDVVYSWGVLLSHRQHALSGEAMAGGVPCIVTEVGDGAYLVGETGLCVPRSQPQAPARSH